jgi:single-strand DNA-binding protein
MNVVILQGNLGADPELRYTQSGTGVLNMRLATAEKYKDKAGEWQETVTWHTVICWGKRGEALAKFLVKGSRLLVRGRISNSSYEDKEGIKRYKSEIVAEDIELLGGKRKDGSDSDDDRSRSRSTSSDRNPPKTRDRDSTPPADGGGFGGDDDIPF